MGLLGPNEIDFVVKVQAEEKIRQLTADIKAQEQAIVQLEAQMKAAGATQKQFLQAAGAGPGLKLKELNQELKALQPAVNNSARGLLYFSQAVEDAQYGFNAIVNNIPMIVLGLGGSAGLAGAVSLAAVALNQWIKNWDSVKEALRDTEPFETVKAKFEALQDLAQRGLHFVINFQAGTYNPDAAAFGERAKQEAEDRKAQAEKGRKAQENVLTKEEQESAKDFREAFAEYEAGDKGKLRREIFLRAQKANPAMRREYEREQMGIPARGTAEEKRRELMHKQIDTIDIMIAEGLAKGTKRPGDFGPGMGAKIEEKQLKRQMDREEKERKEAEANRKKIADFEKQMLEDEKRVRREVLQDQIAEKEKEIKKGMRALTPQQQEQVEDQVTGVKKPKQSQVMSTREYVNRTLTGALSAGDQKIVGEMVKANKTLEGLRNDMKNLNRMR